jgi:tripartite-type tricarboxylate transporter receptor subunit TctC
MKAIVLGLAAVLVAGASVAQPSDYPNRPVKMIAPFAPGGPVDIVARVLAPKLSERLGQQFYVENHPGGSGNIGTALAAKAPADGYTILVISSTLVVNPSSASTPRATLRRCRWSGCRPRCCWSTRPCRQPMSRSWSPG